MSRKVPVIWIISLHLHLLLRKKRDGRGTSCKDNDGDVYFIEIQHDSGSNNLSLYRIYVSNIDDIDGGTVIMTMLSMTIITK